MFADADAKEGVMGLELRIQAFDRGSRIPKQFTADGPDISPALAWSGAPAGTQAWALIMDDPDAPVGTWVHWVVYDLPAATTALAEGASKSLPGGAKTGKNSWNQAAWGGPSPPPGKPHRYFFKLYALAAATGLGVGARKEDLLAAMKGKILAESEWMGTYGR